LLLLLKTSLEGDLALQYIYKLESRIEQILGKY